MANCDPIMERITVWSFTEDEIFHRWEVHQRHDMLNRYAKAFAKEEAEPKVDNSDSALAFLESALPEQGE